jgi:hypothetical protein
MNTKSNETPNHKRTQKGGAHHGPGAFDSRAPVPDSRGVFGDFQEAVEMKTDMDKGLIIGGPNDGERIRFDSSRPYIEMTPKWDPIKIPVSSPFKIPATLNIPIPESRPIEVYRTERLQGPKSQFYLLVHSKLSLDEALAAIVNGYRRP